MGLIELTEKLLEMTYSGAIEWETGDGNVFWVTRNGVNIRVSPDGVFVDGKYVCDYDADARGIVFHARAAIADKALKALGS